MRYEDDADQRAQHAEEFAPREPFGAGEGSDQEGPYTRRRGQYRGRRDRGVLQTSHGKVIRAEPQDAERERQSSRGRDVEVFRPFLLFFFFFLRCRSGSFLTTTPQKAFFRLRWILRVVWSSEEGLVFPRSLGIY